MGKNDQEQYPEKVMNYWDRIFRWCSDKAKFLKEYLTNASMETYQKTRQQAEPTWPDGWFYAAPEVSTLLWNELQLELPEGHTLYQQPVKVIAHRNGTTDDILCSHINEPGRYTVVHLTWSKKTEINKFYPSIEADGDFEGFLNFEKRFSG